MLDWPAKALSLIVVWQLPPSVVAPVADRSFPFMVAQRKHDDPIGSRIVLVERQIARIAARDHQLPQDIVHGSANGGVRSQHLQPAEHEVVGRERRRRFRLAQECHPPFEIGVRALRNDYFGHERNFGLRVFLPCSFAR